MFSRWKTRLGVALARWPGHYRSGEFSANAKSPGAEGGLSAIAGRLGHFRSPALRVTHDSCAAYALALDMLQRRTTAKDLP